MNVIGNPVVSGLSAYVTVGLWGYDILKGALEDDKAQAKYAKNLYIMLDSMDSIYGLYDNVQERENTINAALSIIGEKYIDANKILGDLWRLKETGLFGSSEEAMTFDVTLREFLHNNVESMEQVENLVPLILETMKNGGDLSELLSAKIIGEDGYEALLEKDIDGKAGTSVADLMNYLSVQKTSIDEQFEYQYFPPEIEDSIKQSNNIIKDRLVNIDYHGVLSEEQHLEWLATPNGLGNPNIEHVIVDNQWVIRDPDAHSMVFGVQGDERFAEQFSINLVQDGKNFQLGVTPETSWEQLEKASTFNAHTEAEIGPIYPEDLVGVPTTQSEPTAPTIVSPQVSATETPQTELNGEELTTLGNIDDNITKIHDILIAEFQGETVNSTTEEEKIISVNVGTYSTFDTFLDLYREELSVIEKIKTDLGALRSGVVGGEDINGQYMYLSYSPKISEDFEGQSMADVLTNISTQLDRGNLIGEAELVTGLFDYGIEVANNTLLGQIVTLLTNALNRPPNINITANVYNENDYEKFVDRLAREMTEYFNSSAIGSTLI